MRFSIFCPLQKPLVRDQKNIRKLKNATNLREGNLREVLSVLEMNLIFCLSNAFDESSFGGVVETLEKRAPLGCSKERRSGTERRPPPPPKPKR